MRSKGELALGEREKVEPGITRVMTEDGLRYEATASINGVPKRRRFLKLEEARDFRAKSRIQNRHGLFPVPTRQLLGDYLDGWLTLRERELRSNTMNAYKSQLDLRFGPIYAVALGELAVADINAEIQRNLDEGLSPNSFQLARSALESALDDAVGEELIPRNVAKLATWPKRTAVHIDIMTDTEVRLFLRAIAGSSREPFFLLLLETGMRINEALALEWRHLKLDADVPTVTIEQTMVRAYGTNKWVIQEVPKSDASRRTIPLSAELVPYLRRQLEVARSFITADRVLPSPSAALFPGTNPAGRMGSEGVRYFLSRTFATLRLPPHQPHAFRHTAATHMVRSGLNPKVVAERLGHRDVRTVLDYYVHPDQNDHMAATTVMARFIYG